MATTASTKTTSELSGNHNIQIQTSALSPNRGISKLIYCLSETEDKKRNQWKWTYFYLCIFVSMCHWESKWKYWLVHTVLKLHISVYTHTHHFPHLLCLITYANHFFFLACHTILFISISLVLGVRVSVCCFFYFGNVVVQCERACVWNLCVFDQCLHIIARLPATLFAFIKRIN